MSETLLWIIFISLVVALILFFIAIASARRDWGDVSQKDRTLMWFYFAIGLTFLAMIFTFFYMMNLRGCVSLPGITTSTTTVQVPQQTTYQAIPQQVAYQTLPQATYTTVSQAPSMGLRVGA